VPAAVRNLTGSRLTRTSDGSKIAVLFRHIPGSRPAAGEAYRVGLAAGELSAALARVRIDGAAPYKGHGYLYDIHPAVTRDTMGRFMSQPADGWEIRKLDWLERELARMEEAAERLAGLPRQMIHGDLLYGNVLAEDGRITGILDFEFAAPDTRAMEAAICLTQFVDAKGLSPFAEPFLKGFGENRKLTGPEVCALPLLLELRFLVGFLHHLGRSFIGAAAVEPAMRRLEWLIRATDWIRSREGERTLVRLGETHLL